MSFIFKKLQKINLVKIILFVLLAALIIALICLLVGVTAKSDETAIVPNSSVAQEAKEALLLSAKDVDVNTLMESYTYELVQSEQLYSGVLVSGERESEPSASSLKLVYSALFSSDGLQIASESSAKLKIQSEALIPLANMLEAFYDETSLRTILITNAYEEYEEQEDSILDSDIYYDDDGNYIGYEDIDISEYENSYSNKCAEHSDGYSVDFALYLRESGDFEAFTGEDEYEWFELNSYLYGFVLRYPEGKEELTRTEYQPEHFRYVGEAMAYIMYKNDLCLEEVSDYMSDYTYENPIKVNTISGCYVVYYEKASGYDGTAVRIPTGSDGEAQPYTVLGDGGNGYVVIISPTAEFDISDESEAESESESSSDNSSAGE